MVRQQGGQTDIGAVHGLSIPHLDDLRAALVSAKTRHPVLALEASPSKAMCSLQDDVVHECVFGSGESFCRTQVGENSLPLLSPRRRLGTWAVASGAWGAAHQ